MNSYKIYWDDLTPDAKERLINIKPDNEDFPIAVIETDEVYKVKTIGDFIEHLVKDNDSGNYVIDCSDFNCSECIIYETRDLNISLCHFLVVNGITESKYQEISKLNKNDIITTEFLNSLQL